MNELDDWFVSQVLPLEAALLRFLRHNWRGPEDITDLRQEVYIRVYEAAAKCRPEQAKPFVFSVARNLLIDRARRAQIVSFETVADLAALEVWSDELTPERHAEGRSELRQLETALGSLPPRCRQVVELRKIDGMSQRDVAQRIGITEGTVEKMVAKGMRMLAEALLAKGISAGMDKLRKKSDKKNRAA